MAVDGEGASGLRPNGILIPTATGIGHLCSVTIPSRREGNRVLHEKEKAGPRITLQARVNGCSLHVRPASSNSECKPIFPFAKCLIVIVATVGF